MTKLLFVCGSARKASTAYAIEEAKRAAEAVEDVEVDVLYLHGKKIAPCMGCNACVRFCKIDCQKVNDRECINCGECKKICPEGAINFKTKF